MEKKLGIDIGGVIIDRYTPGEKRLFDDIKTRHKTPAVKDAFECIRYLNTSIESPFSGNTFLVSRVGDQSTEDAVDYWLNWNHFFTETEVFSPAFYCRERKDKLELCKTLGITHFVDDRLEVLSHLVGTVPNLYLFNPQPSNNIGFENTLQFVKIVDNWIDLKEMLLLKTDKEYYSTPGQFNDEASDVIEAGYKESKVFRKKDQE